MPLLRSLVFFGGFGYKDFCTKILHLTALKQLTVLQASRNVRRRKSKIVWYRRTRSERQRVGALQNASQDSEASDPRASVLDCGGKRSATPLLQVRYGWEVNVITRPKAVSPPGSATAVQIIFRL
jgi:hypothetical protein